MAQHDLAQHDHTITFAATTGSQWLWIPVLAGVATVAAAALLRPVVPVEVRSAQRAVTGVAGGVGLLVLLLAPELDLPRPAVALLVLALAVPVAVARHPTGPGAPRWVHPVRAVAPAVVVAAGAGAGVALAGAWPAGPGSGEPVFTGLFLGVVGLSWLLVCGPRSRSAAAAVHGTGYLLAHLVLGAATVAAVAAMPG